MSSPASIVAYSWKQQEQILSLRANVSELLAAAVKALAECCDLVGTDAGNALEAAVARAKGDVP